MSSKFEYLAKLQLAIGEELEKKEKQAAFSKRKGQFKGRSSGRGRGGHSGFGGRKCYNCGGEGHMSRDCQQPREKRCYNCQESGHISKNCPKKAEKVTKNGADKTVVEVNLTNTDQEKKDGVNSS